MNRVVRVGRRKVVMIVVIVMAVKTVMFVAKSSWMVQVRFN